MTDPRIEAAAKALWDHRSNTGTWHWHQVSEDTHERYRAEASAALAAADKASIISTYTDLDSLPDGSAIVDAMDAVLALGHGCFYSPGHSQPTSLSEVALPARVLYRP